MKHKKINKILQQNKGLLFIFPSLFGVCLFLLFPFIDVVRRSFADTFGINFVGLENYKMTFSNAAFQVAAKNTVRFVAVCIPILLVLSLIIAVFLQRKTILSEYVKKGLLVPLAIPVVSIVLLWRIVFDNSGFLNSFLNVFGIAGKDWMNTEYAFGVLVFSYIWKNLGYNVVLWIVGLSSIPREIYEAAQVDGAGAWKSFCLITIPNMKSTFFTTIVLSLINSFKVFREAYLVAGNYPDESMYLLQHIFNNWFQNMEVSKMSAGAVSMSVVMVSIIMLLKRVWEER